MVLASLPSLPPVLQNSKIFKRMGLGLLMVVLYILLVLGIYKLLSPAAPSKPDKKISSTPSQPVSTAQTVPPADPPVAESAPTTPPIPDAEWTAVWQGLSVLEEQRRQMLQTALPLTSSPLLSNHSASAEVEMPSLSALQVGTVPPKAVEMPRSTPPNQAADWMRLSQHWLDFIAVHRQTLSPLAPPAATPPP